MTNIDAEQYRTEWATKTGRAPSEIYVPLALRDPEPETLGSKVIRIEGKLITVAEGDHEDVPSA